MNRVVKFILVPLFAVTFMVGYSQRYFYAPAADEKVKEIMSSKDFPENDPDRKIVHYKNYASSREWYMFFLEKARKKYPNTWVDIRNMKYSREVFNSVEQYNEFYEPITCEVVYKVNPQDQWLETLSQGMDRAFRNVREGSRIAIDQVTAVNGVDKEEMKDKIIDVLLDKGYKVVAKDYLERLYAEQKTQQSGIYNDNTTVQENNFSAVGYFVNVKVTESSVRVQVINVSTGEYEGNATINF